MGTFSDNDKVPNTWEMSAERAVLRASKKLGSPPGKPSGYCSILNHLYDSECSGSDDDELRSVLRRKTFGIFDGIEATRLEERNKCEFIIICCLMLT